MKQTPSEKIIEEVRKLIKAENKLCRQMESELELPPGTLRRSFQRKSIPTKLFDVLAKRWPTLSTLVDRKDLEDPTFEEKNPYFVFHRGLTGCLAKEKLSKQKASVELGFNPATLTNSYNSKVISVRLYDAIIQRWPQLEKLLDRKLCIVSRGPAALPATSIEHVDRTTKLVGMNDLFAAGCLLASLSQQPGGQLWVEGLETADRMGLRLDEVVRELKGTMRLRHAS